MTGMRDGAGGPPDLLVSLPDERPACGIDPAAIDEILACVRELQEDHARGGQKCTADRIEAAQAHLSERIDGLAGSLAADRTEAGKAIGIEIGDAIRRAIIAEMEGAVLRVVGPRLEHAMKLQDDGNLGVYREIAMARNDVLKEIGGPRHNPELRSGWRTYGLLLAAFALGMFCAEFIPVVHAWMYAG